MPLNSSGMVTTSATNPLDEIPIGPQVFPYGTPQGAESQVEPYLSTNYPTPAASTLVQSVGAYPTTTSTVQAVPTYSVIQTPVAESVPAVTYETPQIAYQPINILPTPVYGTEVVGLGAYQLPQAQAVDLGVAYYQNFSVPAYLRARGYQIATGYQDVIRYLPVKKTVAVPRYKSSLVSFLTNSSLNTSVAPVTTLGSSSIVVPTAYTPLPPQVGASVLGTADNLIMSRVPLSTSVPIGTVLA